MLYGTDSCVFCLLPAILLITGFSCTVGLAASNWKREGIGGLLALAGILCLHIVERRILFGGIFGFCDLVAVLNLLSWRLGRPVVEDSVSADKAKE